MMLRTKLLLILPMVLAVTVGQSDGIGYYGSSNVRDQSPRLNYGSRFIRLPPRRASLNRPDATAGTAEQAVPKAPFTTALIIPAQPSAPIYTPIPNPGPQQPLYRHGPRPILTPHPPAASEHAHATLSPQSPETVASQLPVKTVTPAAAVQLEHEIPIKEFPPVPYPIEPIPGPKPIPITEPALVFEPEPALVFEPEPMSEPSQILELEPILEPKQILQPEPNSEPKQILQPEPISEPKEILQPISVSEPKQILQPEPIFEPKKIPLPEPIIEPLPPSKSEYIPLPVPQPEEISVIESNPQPIPISGAPFAYPKGAALPPLLPKRKPIREPAFGRHTISPTPPTIYYPTPPTISYPTSPKISYPTSPTIFYPTPPTISYPTPPKISYPTPPKISYPTPPTIYYPTPRYPQPTLPTQTPPVIVTEHQHPAVPRPTGILKSDFLCTEGNGYYSVANECDTYIECKQAKAMKFSCPDGLHFNPAAKHYEYPCAFPSEVKCVAGAEQQTPKPSNQCPNQFGFYPMNEPDCSKYIMCQDGLATVMNCPKGLAFNPQISNCDWPANVPQCNPDAFKDFTCPAPHMDDDGQISDIIYKYRFQGQCKQYVACLLGHPRLLSCDPGLSFDEASQTCVDEDYVAGCAVPY